MPPVKSEEQPLELVEARDVAYRVLLREILPPVSLTLRTGECWVVTGPNGSGKSVLTEILAGLRSPTSGYVRWKAPRPPSDDAAVVSFEALERVISAERRNDESSIMHGRVDPGRSVREFLAEEAGDPQSDRTAALARRFGLDGLYDRGLRFLSTGELRKTLLAAALAREPALLVLDEPYDGLDARSRRELVGLVEGACSPDRCVLVVANRRRDIPACATHEVELSAGELRSCGPRGSPAGRSFPAGPIFPAAVRGNGDEDDRLRPVAALPSPGPPAGSQPIVVMRDVRLAYGDTQVLAGVDWQVRYNDRWMITGPNGSGKSTLLSLITADNAKAYGQHIEIFGRRRGSGESVWEIKRRIGIVSGDLQLAYPLRTTVEETVLSGFHDSIGLYERPGGYEREIARRWIAQVGLGGWEDRRLRELSFGMRRMLLVARAVVKSPDILIADEPCQGLDDHHAAQVLDLLDTIGNLHDHCMLYVTHDPAERLGCITHTLELVPGPHGSRVVTRRADADRNPS